MPFTFQQHQVFTLREVGLSIQKTIANRYSKAYWIKAEMNKLNYYSYSGHCYPELVEKQNGKVVAQMRSTLWKGTYDSINQKFLQQVKEPLKDGIMVLLLAQIHYDAVYGISLNIIDIDPSFTLGDLEREKKETIERLNSEGLFYKNKQLSLPLLPQRIAILSVETSKGYADFIKILNHNPYGFQFHYQLFPVILQGEKAITTIRTQLKNLQNQISNFDIVVIVRGGGGDVGLSTFNNYSLAHDIATFPLPIFTGIGHATNETVTEMVAHKNAITPTEIAQILIHLFLDLDHHLNRAKVQIKNRLQQRLIEEKNLFEKSTRLLIALTKNMLFSHKSQLDATQAQLTQYAKFLIKRHHEYHLQLGKELNKSIQHFLELQEQSLKTLQEKLQILDPKNILKRGYSITTLNGKPLMKLENIQEGDEIKTQLLDGEFQSVITYLPKNK